MVIITSLGREIRRQRLAAGLSQEALAGLLDVERTTIGRWERDEARPSPGQIKKLLRLKLVDRGTIVDLLDRQAQSAQREYVVSIVAPRILVNRGCEFRLLHVRSGQATRRLDDRILNEIVDFVPTGDRGEMRATILASSRLGVEFKCFVESNGLSFDEIKAELEARGFTEPSIGEGKLRRTWFLLPDYRIVADGDTGIRNNFYFPE